MKPLSGGAGCSNGDGNEANDWPISSGLIRCDILCSAPHRDSILNASLASDLPVRRKVEVRWVYLAVGGAGLYLPEER